MRLLTFREIIPKNNPVLSTYNRNAIDFPTLTLLILRPDLSTSSDAYSEHATQEL